MPKAVSESSKSPAVHPAALGTDTLLAECTEVRTRRSGPGGQHRNKVETAVVLTHTKTGIRAEASERRSQHENRKQAVFRLRLNLAVEHRGDFAKLPEPSDLWQSRCRNGRIQVSRQHDDFPSLLAEALDHVVILNGNVRNAASHLTCSTTQLVRFLKQDPRAFQLVNQQRSDAGLGPLH